MLSQLDQLQKFSNIRKLQKIEVKSQKLIAFPLFTLKQLAQKTLRAFSLNISPKKLSLNINYFSQFKTLIQKNFFTRFRKSDLLSSICDKIV